MCPSTCHPSSGAIVLRCPSLKSLAFHRSVKGIAHEARVRPDRHSVGGDGCNAFWNPHLLRSPDHSAHRPTSPPSHTSKSPLPLLPRIRANRPVERYSVSYSPGEMSIVGEVFGVDLIPLNVNIPQIRERGAAGDSLGVEHLPKTLRISMTQGGDLPMRRHVAPATARRRAWWPDRAGRCARQSDP